MRAIEFIAEANIDIGIDSALRQKGYKRLGKGVDQNVYLEPGTGMVMKIFRSNASSTGGDHLTPGQKTFKAFADYCLANPDNEFLPNFSGWETFKFNNMLYLQIRTERMFPIDPDRGYFLEELATAARLSTQAWQKDQFIDTAINDDTIYDETTRAEMLSMLGSDGFNQLWDTINDLNQIAIDGRFKMDLHGGNFMLGSDGHIVISDPFFIGWNHPDLRNDSGDDGDEEDWVADAASKVPEEPEEEPEEDEQEIDQYGVMR